MIITLIQKNLFAIEISLPPSYKGLKVIKAALADTDCKFDSPALHQKDMYRKEKYTLQLPR